MRPGRPEISFSGRIPQLVQTDRAIGPGPRGQPGGPPSEAESARLGRVAGARL